MSPAYMQLSLTCSTLSSCWHLPAAGQSPAACLLVLSAIWNEQHRSRTQPVTEILLPGPLALPFAPCQPAPFRNGPRTGLLWKWGWGNHTQKIGMTSQGTGKETGHIQEQTAQLSQSTSLEYEGPLLRSQAPPSTAESWAVASAAQVTSGSSMVIKHTEGTGCGDTIYQARE